MTSPPGSKPPVPVSWTWKHLRVHWLWSQGPRAEQGHHAAQPARLQRLMSAASLRPSDWGRTTCLQPEAQEPASRRACSTVSEKLAEPTSCHRPISFHALLESNPHPGGEIRGRRKAALLRGLRKLGQGWRLPGVNTKPLPWSWAFGDVLESSGDLEELEEAH